MIDELKSYVWRKAAVCSDSAYPPSAFRQDHRGRLISWNAYGKPDHPQGWQISRVTSAGADNYWNCRAESWQTSQEVIETRRRTGEYPLWAPAAVVAPLIS